MAIQGPGGERRSINSPVPFHLKAGDHVQGAVQGAGRERRLISSLVLFTLNAVEDQVTGAVQGEIIIPESQKPQGE